MKGSGLYFRYFSNAKGTLFLSIALILIQTFSLLPIATLLRHVFDTLLPAQDTEKLFLTLLAVLGLFFLNALALVWNRHLILAFVKTTTYRIRADVIAHLMSAKRSFYSGSDLDALHTTVVQDSERIDFMTSALFTQFIPGVLIVTGLSFCLLIVNPVLFLVIAITFPLLYILGRNIGSSVQARTRTFHADFARFSKGVSFFLRFSDFIKASSAESYERLQQEKIIHDLRHSSQRMSWLSTVYTIVQNNLLVVIGVVVLLLGGLQVIEGITTLGAILSFYVVLNLLTGQARSVIGSFPVLLEGIESFRSLSPLLSTLPLSTLSETKPALSELSSIECRNVSFAHPETPGLFRISFSLEQGMSAAILGPSGSGKSTITHLLLGLYEPDGGVIAANGNDLQTIDQHSYRSQIGVLLQDPAFFAGSIRENLVYGITDVSEEELIRICSLCQIHETIMRLTDGYDSLMGERGVTLSGGQRQRIAIARALLRKPKLLILDEPNNNLADDMVISIVEAVRKENCMLLLITHNEKLVANLDVVYRCVIDPITATTTLRKQS